MATLCALVTVGVGVSSPAEAQIYHDGSRPAALGAGTQQAVREFGEQITAYVSWVHEQEIAAVVYQIGLYVQWLADQQAAEAARQAEIARQQAAARVAAPAATPTASVGGPLSYERLMALHNCEQPNSWTVHGRFGNGLMGGGGFGLSDGAWADWGGLKYAPYAGAATPEQQMEIVQEGWRRYGNAPWGCKV